MRKSVICTIIVLFSQMSSADLPLDPEAAPEEFRCRFYSPYSNSTVTHRFKIHAWPSQELCEYGIEVNQEKIEHSRAFNQDCQDFMKLQINKGSVCLTNASF